MLAGSFLLAAASAPSSLTVDLDGDSRPETVEASVRAGRVRFTARAASGKRIAAAQAPAPRDAAAAVALRAGSLGSAGAMLEVLAASDREECRTLWRVRSGKLQQLPLRSPEAAIPDCGAAGQWTSRFDRPSEDAPAVYLREQSRETPQGLHHVTQVFRFSGFGLDREQVRAEIRGVSIPQWYDGTLYPRTSIEALAELFDFDPLRQLPRLTISASPSRGEFVLRFREPGGTRELAVRSQDVGGDGGITLHADGNGLSATATVKLARDVPYEVLVTGLPERYQHLYSPASRLTQEGLQVFPNAEAQLASDALPGGWVSDKGERVLIEPVSEALGRVRIGEETFALDVLRAPAGTDLLLIGRETTSALDLRGRHAFTRRPARCGENSSEDSPCVAAGPPGEVFRRIGARVNVR